MTDSEIYQSARDFYEAILAAPGSHSHRLVFADWLEDSGIDPLKARETVELPAFSNVLPAEYYGSGSGSGSGIGSGSGSGSGRGIWRGRGRGIGRGIGRGRGSGSGSGIGRGIGIGIGRLTIVETGKAYLVTTVDWFAWVGRVIRQIGPWEYEFCSCSKIVDTHNGDCWEALASGDNEARKRAEYRHYTTPVILGMGVVAKIEWVGKTPQETEAS